MRRAGLSTSAELLVILASLLADVNRSNHKNYKNIKKERLKPNYTASLVRAPGYKD